MQNSNDFADPQAPWMCGCLSPNKAEGAHEKKIVLRDGRRVVIRPAVIEDAEAILEMHARLSADTLYYRYLHPFKPQIADARRFAGAGSQGGHVLVAVEADRPERIVGLALFEPSRLESGESGAAEPAFLVEDDYQGAGLGRVLYNHLIGCASSRGLREFRAYVHLANRRAASMMQNSGLPSKSQYDDGLRLVRVELDPACKLL